MDEAAAASHAAYGKVSHQFTLANYNVEYFQLKSSKFYIKIEHSLEFFKIIYVRVMRDSSVYERSLKISFNETKIFLDYRV